MKHRRYESHKTRKLCTFIASPVSRPFGIYGLFETAANNDDLLSQTDKILDLYGFCDAFFDFV
jgi:hypothetical protein